MDCNLGYINLILLLFYSIICVISFGHTINYKWGLINILFQFNDSYGRRFRGCRILRTFCFLFLSLLFFSMTSILICCGYHLCSKYSLRILWRWFYITRIAIDCLLLWKHSWCLLIGPKFNIYRHSLLNLRNSWCRLVFLRLAIKCHILQHFHNSWCNFICTIIFKCHILLKHHILFYFSNSRCNIVVTD